MIIMRIKGGLGNQLFQYAAAYALAKRLGQPFQFNVALTRFMTERSIKFSELKVDVDKIMDADKVPWKIKIIQNHFINKICRVMNFHHIQCGDYLYFLETRFVLQTDFFNINKLNIYIDGYFQSEDYFKEYRKELLRQFTPNYAPDSEYLNALEEIQNCNSIAIHCRRGDFSQDNRVLHFNPFHYLLGEDYYKRAVAFMKDCVENPVFFCFSDDIEWMKEHVGKGLEFRYISIKTPHGDIDDMMLMKNCNHIIAANSTFSWWAAWLNEHENAIRVVPEKPYGMEGMIPPTWIKL